MKNKSYFQFLPDAIRLEILCIMKSRGMKAEEISEIHLRAAAKSTIYIKEQKFSLLHSLNKDKLADCFRMLCEGSVYSHLDTIKEGYIVAPDGVRVGICGRARYDNGKIYCYDEISSLTFRIPSQDCEENGELIAHFNSAKRGMLIFSPVRYGKTTALKNIAKSVSKGKNFLEVAVVDERGEFSSIDTSLCSIDILSGHKKAAGIEIALRTLSPDVIIVDELSKLEECEAICDFIRGGTRLLASAHGSSLNDLKSRRGVGALIDRGCFDVFVGIELCGGERRYIRYD